ncbi:MAG: hypothetical protein KF809_02790 [Chloroflexi bacterium]|nr:hypothetical protein [Chloroflexota bacterium]
MTATKSAWRQSFDEVDPAPFMDAARERWTMMTTDQDGEPKARAMRIYRDLHKHCKRMVLGYGGRDEEDWLSQDVVAELETAIEQAVMLFTARVLARRDAVMQAREVAA